MKTLSLGLALAFAVGISAQAQQLLKDMSSAEQNDLTPDSGVSRSAGGQRAQILSAFFGLDNSRRIRRAGLRFCGRPSGTDGMPLVFSHELDIATIEAGDIEITLRSGKKGSVNCVSLAPAIEPGELRTLLLIGDFGSAEANPPIRVKVIGNLHAADGSVNFRGASVEVIPLVTGPALVFAENVARTDWQFRPVSTGRGMSDAFCPQEGLQNILRVVWDGGVELASGEEIGPEHAGLYRVTIETSDGSVRTVRPFAIGNLGDGDNNHELCLNTEGRPVSVAFPAGHLVDPNHDVNANTSVAVQR